MAYVKVEEKRRLEQEREQAERKAKWDKLTDFEKWNALLKSASKDNSYRQAVLEHMEQRFDEGREKHGIKWAVETRGLDIMKAHYEAEMAKVLMKRVLIAAHDESIIEAKRLQKYAVTQVLDHAKYPDSKSTSSIYNYDKEAQAAGYAKLAEWCEAFLSAVELYDNGQQIYPEYA